jgi:YesN/AraC family two-component response regulator
MRLLLIFICFSFVFSLAITIIFYVKSHDELALEKKQSERLFIKQVSQQIDTIWLTANYTVNQLTINQTFNEFAAASEPSMLQIYETTKVISKVVTALPNISYTIGVKKVNDDRVITPNHTIGLDRYLKELKITDNGRLQLKQYISDMENNTDWLVLSLDGEHTDVPNTRSITIAKRIANQEVLLMLMVTIPSVLGDSDTYAQSFAITNKDSFMAWENKGKMPVPAERVSLIRTAPLYHADSDPSYVYQLSDGWHTHYVKSQVMRDMNYIYLINRGSFWEQKALQQLLLRTSILFVIMLSVGAASAIIFARNSYRPIDRLIKAIPNQEKRATKDELGYIEQIILDISESNESLHHILNIQATPLKHKFLRDLVHGLQIQEGIRSEAEAHELLWLDQSTHILLIEYNGDEGNDMDFSKQAAFQIRAEVNHLLQHVFRRKLLNQESFEISYQWHCFILSGTDEYELKKLLHQLYSYMDILETFKIKMAISKASESLEQLEERYQEAARTMQLIPVQTQTPETYVYVWEDLNALSSDYGFYYPLDAERELIGCVLRGKPEEADKRLQLIFKENDGRNLSPQVLLDGLTALMATFQRIKQQLDTGTLMWIDTLTADSEHEYRDPEHMKAGMKELFRALASRLQEQQELQAVTGSGSMKELLKYVEDNYMKDVSLAELSERFKLSQGHISRSFPKYTGETFKEYLNQYRVLMSKEILRTESIKIIELAERVGFNNPRSFIRMFKKYTGTSPGAYQKNEEAD